MSLTTSCEAICFFSSAIVSQAASHCWVEMSINLPKQESEQELVWVNHVGMRVSPEGKDDRKIEASPITPLIFGRWCLPTLRLFSQRESWPSWPLSIPQPSDWSFVFSTRLVSGWVVEWCMAFLRPVRSGPFKSTEDVVVGCVCWSKSAQIHVSPAWPCCDLGYLLGFPVLLQSVRQFCVLAAVYSGLTVVWVRF